MRAKFWMVWCAGSGAPTYKHETEESARMEAERLAKLHPGAEFTVFEALAVCNRTDVAWVELTDGPLF